MKRFWCWLRTGHYPIQIVGLHCGECLRCGAVLNLP